MRRDVCWFPSDALENTALSQINSPFDQSAVRDQMYRSIVIFVWNFFAKLGVFLAAFTLSRDDIEVGKRLKSHQKGFSLLNFSISFSF
jgi:hypothetical protein